MGWMMIILAAQTGLVVAVEPGSVLEITSGRGTTSVVLHFGQVPFFPAAASPTRITAVQYGQLNSMAIAVSWQP